MTRRLVVALALVALPATPAKAAGDSLHRGDCSYDLVHTSLNESADEWDGVVYAAVAVYSPSSAAPVSAIVTCHVLVDGIEQHTVSMSGTGVVAFADPMRVDVRDDQYLDVCTEIDFTSDDTPTVYDCGYYSEPFPPQEVVDLIDDVFDLADAAVCDQTGGDVYVAGEWIFDCPPYGI